MEKKSEKCYCKQDKDVRGTDRPNQEDKSSSVSGIPGRSNQEDKSSSVSGLPGRPKQEDKSSSVSGLPGRSKQENPSRSASGIPVRQNQVNRSSSGTVISVITGSLSQDDRRSSNDTYGHPAVSEQGRRGKVRSKDDFVDSEQTNKSIHSVLKKVSSSVSQDKSDCTSDKSETKPKATCTCGRILALDYKPSYNVQYKNNIFFLEIDVEEFTPDGLRVSMTNEDIKIEGVVLQRHDDVDQVCAEFTKTYTIPEEMDPTTTSAELYSNGILVIKAKKKTNSSFSSDKGIPSTSLPLEKTTSSHVKVEVGRHVECGNCNELRKAPPESIIVPITQIKENYKGVEKKPKECRCSKIDECIKFV